MNIISKLIENIVHNLSLPDNEINLRTNITNNATTSNIIFNIGEFDQEDNQDHHKQNSPVLGKRRLSEAQFDIIKKKPKSDYHVRFEKSPEPKKNQDFKKKKYCSTQRKKDTQENDPYSVDETNTDGSTIKVISIFLIINQQQSENNFST